jgi:two-component system phosphate regulon response regulator OmpR
VVWLFFLYDNRVFIMTKNSNPLSDALNLPHILVVDDDTRIRDLLERYLEQNGFLITLADSAATARAFLTMLEFDAIVLDIMMPGEDGLKLAKSLQQNNFKTPILFLTAKSDSEQRIEGLEAGADDYLAKPFEPRELVLRLSAVLKRQAAMPVKQQKNLSIGGWIYDDVRTLLVKNDQAQPLTRAEGTLLNIFLQKPHSVFSRAELAKLTNLEGQERTVDVQVTRLRRKLEPDPKKPRYLQTVRGEGYILYVD